MHRLILMTGKPEHGKSYLAKHLVERHSFTALSVDDAYVDFVKTQCPMLYFGALHLYIGMHYDGMVENCDGYSGMHLGRRFDDEWRAHLVTRIRDLAALESDVVVEGYLLKPKCVGQVRQAVSSLAQVFEVCVENRRYFLSPQELTADEVAGLGA